MRSIQYLNLDINKKTQQTITANVGEVGSRYIKIKMIDNDKPLDLTGVSVFLYALKSDDTKVFSEVEIEDATNGIIMANLTSQLMTKAGSVKLTLVLLEQDKKLGSKEFVLNVDESILDDEVVESTNEFSALTTALGKVQGIDNKFANIDEQFNTIESEKINKVVLNKVENTLDFYKKDFIAFSINLTEASNNDLVRQYIDTLVQNGAIAGVTVDDGTITKTMLDNDMNELLNNCIKSKIVEEKTAFDYTSFTRNTSGGNIIYVEGTKIDKDSIVQSVTVNHGYSQQGAFKIIIFSKNDNNFTKLHEVDYTPQSSSISHTVDINYITHYDCYIGFQASNSNNTIARSTNVTDKSLIYELTSSDNENYVYSKTSTSFVVCASCNIKTITSFDYVTYERCLNVVDEKINNYELPSYYHEYLETKLKEIYSKEELVSLKGDSFIFFTDYHIDQNACHSPNIIKKLYDKTQINKVIFGGDALNDYEDKSVALEKLRTFRQSFNWCDNFYFMRGNHEINPYSTENLARLSESECYNYTTKSIEKVVNTNRKFYYSFDNESQKIRYIICDSDDKSEEQNIWLKNLLANSEGYTIVFFSHINGHRSSENPPSLIVDVDTTRFGDILRDSNRNIACMICGHSHIDGSVIGYYNFPIIATTADGYNTSAKNFQTRILGTTTEHAIDVFSIDILNRKIYTTRIGAGNNREFTY